MAAKTRADGDKSHVKGLFEPPFLEGEDMRRGLVVVGASAALIGSPAYALLSQQGVKTRPL
jgi:hypothetical protein